MQSTWLQKASSSDCSLPPDGALAAGAAAGALGCSGLAGGEPLGAPGAQAASEASAATCAVPRSRVRRVTMRRRGGGVTASGTSESSSSGVHAQSASGGRTSSATAIPPEHSWAENSWAGNSWGELSTHQLDYIGSIGGALRARQGAASGNGRTTLVDALAIPAGGSEAMSEWQDVERRLVDGLGLMRRPVAVAFRAEPPAGVAQFTGSEPSGCSFWRLAAEGRAFYTVPSDHYNCAIGSYTHNIPLSPERAPELEQTLGFMT